MNYIICNDELFHLEFGCKGLALFFLLMVCLSSILYLLVSLIPSILCSLICLRLITLLSLRSRLSASQIIEVLFLISKLNPMHFYLLQAFLSSSSQAQLI